MTWDWLRTMCWSMQSSDEEISVALDRAIDDAIDKILAERNLTPAS